MFHGQLSAVLIIFDIIQLNFSNRLKSNLIEIQYNFDHFSKFTDFLGGSFLSKNHNSSKTLSTEQTPLGIPGQILILPKRNPLVSEDQISRLKDIPLGTKRLLINIQLPFIKDTLSEFVLLKISDQFSTAQNPRTWLWLNFSIQFLHQMKILSLLLGESSHHTQLRNQKYLLDSLILFLL